MGKQRNSSLEVIRIICMFLIITWHTINPFLNEMDSSQLFPLLLINALTNTSNLLFMLISGYFGINYNLKKLIQLDLAIIFYDVLFLFVLGNFSVKALIFSLMPITFKNHWFLTCYFAICLLSVFLNKISEQLNRRAFRNLLLLLIAIFFVIPTLFFQELIEDSGKGIVCMTIIYLIGRYIRMYYDCVSFKKSRLALTTALLILATNIPNILLSLMKKTYMGMYCRDNSILILLLSITVFLFFREMHFTNRFINHLAKNVVILYCIEGYVRSLAGRFFNLSEYTNSYLFIPIGIAFALIIYILCLLFNELRTLVLGRFDGFLASRISSLLTDAAVPAANLAIKVKERLLSYLSLS